MTLQTVCLRHQPDGLAGEELDAHTLAWANRVNAAGAAYLTTARMDGSWFVRVSIGVESTERHHVERLWQLLQDAVEPG